MINNIDLEKLKQIQPRCIIVVEKEGIFLTMYKHKFTKLIPSIIVCAKGNLFILSFKCNLSNFNKDSLT